MVESALDCDSYGVIGSHVFNGADHEATQVKIVCAVYDLEGNVIDSVFGYTDPILIQIPYLLDRMRDLTSLHITRSRKNLLQAATLNL